MQCSLGKGELMRLGGGGQRLRLRCLKGTLWLTTGDGRDYLVHEGGTFELKEGSSALAEALDAAKMHIEIPLSAAAGVKLAASRPCAAH